MRLFGGNRVIRCRKGEWTRVISNFGTGMPARWTMTFMPSEPGREMKGTFRERRYFWIFPQAARTGPLENRMVFERYWINAIYRLDVLAEGGDVLVTVEGGVFG